MNPWVVAAALVLFFYACNYVSYRFGRSIGSREAHIQGFRAGFQAGLATQSILDSIHHTTFNLPSKN